MEAWDWLKACENFAVLFRLFGGLRLWSKVRMYYDNVSTAYFNEGTECLGSTYIGEISKDTKITKQLRQEEAPLETSKLLVTTSPQRGHISQPLRIPILYPRLV